MLKSKKGDVTDVMIWLITIFILAIGLFIFAFFVPELSQGLRNSNINSSAEGEFAINEMEDFGVVTIQRGFFFLFVGLIIGVMISSFLVRTHPIFLFLYILMLGLTVFIGTYLGNAFDQMTEIDIFAETLASQTLISAVMNNIITITIAVGALSFIIVFAKFSSGTRESTRQF